MDLLEKKIVHTRIIISRKQEDFQEACIHYYYGISIFGKFLFAFYNDELCYLKFYNTDFQSCLDQLQRLYPNANFVYNNRLQDSDEVNIILKGTEFDVKVWSELLKIKKGNTVSYNDIAIAIGNEKSVRAVGNAVGRNNISYIVPCHRVLKKTGCLGGFSSGPYRKLKMLNYEGVEIK